MKVEFKNLTASGRGTAENNGTRFGAYCGAGGGIGSGVGGGIGTGTDTDAVIGAAKCSGCISEFAPPLVPLPPRSLISPPLLLLTFLPLPPPCPVRMVFDKETALETPE